MSDNWSGTGPKPTPPTVGVAITNSFYYRWLLEFNQLLISSFILLTTIIERVVRVSLGPMHMPIKGLAVPFAVDLPLVHDSLSQVRVRYVEPAKTDSIAQAGSNFGQTGLRSEGIVGYEDAGEEGPEGFADIWKLLLLGVRVLNGKGVELSRLSQLHEAYFTVA